MSVIVREHLQQAIVEAIAPQPSQNTKKAVEIAKKYKCVQTKECKVLTTPAVHAEEAKTRYYKKKPSHHKYITKEKSSKKCCKDLVMNINDHEEQENSEEEDDTVCNICVTLWKTYTKKGMWLKCSIFDDYICPKHMSADTDLDSNFCSFHCSA